MSPLRARDPVWASFHAPTDSLQRFTEAYHSTGGTTNARRTPTVPAEGAHREGKGGGKGEGRKEGITVRDGDVEKRQRGETMTATRADTGTGRHGTKEI